MTTDGNAVGERGDGRRDRSGDGRLAELRTEARELVSELAGPVRRVHLRRGDTELEIEWPDPASAFAAPSAAPVGSATPGSGAPAAVPATGPGAAVPAEDGSHTVLSPMVGTFYRAPEPGRPPYVEVGDLVEAGRVIGIVEAMKLMNEVTAGRAGRVLDLLAADGQPVEYGQPLIALAPVG
ncbi:acetyl-CoA carboxylase biotin carboxyl carrier protein [Plantactinospora siamensis]|uniref:Biotin carboxyl carrier protein of acetyl-CoA carboxylase n=1 Tax=Plantactinospora siamensis TaxID=555372 RepID=A0ABV6P2V8_9ACTN